MQVTPEWDSRPGLRAFPKKKRRQRASQVQSSPAPSLLWNEEEVRICRLPWSVESVGEQLPSDDYFPVSG